MTRLVVIDLKKNTLKIFENNKCIAEFETSDPSNDLTPELIEELRTDNYESA